MYNGDDPWVKKTNESFDVTMGAYDGAEICELIGLYLLSIISNSYNKDDIGLYRDDGLSVFQNISGPQADRIKKHFHAIFKKNGLCLEIECNLKIVNYLEVSLDLNTGTFKPYRKPNDETIYVNAESNHPPNIIKQLPISIERRLCKLSCNEEIFQEASKHYQEALNKSGHTHMLQYKANETNTSSSNKQRKRKIIWFNPPFSKNVSTNMGKYFLKLLDKHFPKRHPYQKIFNRNTVKVSYSCMPNIKSIVSGHNKSILNEYPENNKTCNCMNKELCPLDNKCLTDNIVYEATITSNQAEYGPRTYIGISETTF